MASITVTVQSLLNTALYDSYTIDNGQTVAQLKTAINSARGFNSTWYDLVNGNVLTEGSTLASLGIIAGTQLRTHNKISRLTTKEAKQNAKLALATLDRVASGETRVTLDTTQLPTLYSGNAISNNSNTSGLVEGRPWTSTVTLRSFLSGAGQTAYDAAAANSFFAVSSSDWDAVITGLGNTTKLGPDDTNFNATSGAAFSGGYYFTASQTLATVPASNYIIGFRASTIQINSSWSLWGSATFKSYNPNPYTQISTTTPSTGSGAGGTGTFYYLRKAPSVQATATYVAYYSTQNFDMTPNGSYLTPISGATSSAYSTNLSLVWSNWVDRIPKIQTLITPTAVT